MPVNSEQKKSQTTQVKKQKSPKEEKAAETIMTISHSEAEQLPSSITDRIIDDIGLDNDGCDFIENKPHEDAYKHIPDDQINEIRKVLLSKARQKQIRDITATATTIPTKISTKEVSYKFGVVGLGHAGSRLAGAFYSLGYKAVALNTATQDLVHIEIPEANKLFLNIGIQGAAKDLNRGELAAESFKNEIIGLITDKLSESDVLVICSSTGGGSGAGSLNTVVELCQLTNKPIVIMAVLPMASDDVKTKTNSIETLSKLTNFVATGKVHSIILVDNAKIESLYSDVSQMNFYEKANKSIVEPLDVFNTFSMKPSKFKPLDSMEFATLLLDGDGISTYGEVIISDFEEDVGLGNAILASLQENLLSSGLDYTQAKRVGYIVIGHEIALSKISTSALTYAHAKIEEMFGSPETVYKGIYIDNSINGNVVKIYTFVSGLGVPAERIVEMQKEIINIQDIIKSKTQERAKTLMVDTGKTLTLSNIDKIKQQMSQKLSGLGKLNSIKR